MYGLSPIGAKPITDLWKPRQKKEKEDISFHHFEFLRPIESNTLIAELKKSRNRADPVKNCYN